MASTQITNKIQMPMFNDRNGMGCATAALAVLLFAACLDGAEPFDIVIRGGRVVDGTGAPWYAADVGIRGGKIAKIGRLHEAQAKRTIDAAGLVVAPGFIDMMGQTATPLMENPASAINLLTQGITTINAGEGVSAAPLDEVLDLLLRLGEPGAGQKRHLVALGEHWGEGTFTGGARPGRSPLGVAFELADDHSASNVIPPQGARELDGYFGGSRE